MKRLFVISILCLLKMSLSTVPLLSADEPKFRSVYDVAWSPDGVILAIAADTGLWFYYPLTDTFQSVGDLGGGIGGLIWSPDGNQLLSGLTIINRSTKLVEAVREISGSSFGWSKDGRQIAAIINDAQDIGIIDAATGKLAKTIVIGRGEIIGATWSPDETRFAVTSLPTGSIFIVSNSDNPSVTEYTQQPPTLRLAWSPDGRFLAGGAGDMVRVWDASTIQPVYAMQGHSIGLYRLNWSPDSKQLATAQIDGEVLVWDIDTGKVIDHFETFGYVGNIDFSPYGGRLVISNDIERAALNSDTLVPTSVPAQMPGNLVTNISNGAVEIVAPAPSLEKLQTISQSCGMQPGVQASLSAEITHSDLPAFTQQVTALNDTQIPPGCKADLLAVAQALQAREQP